MQDLTTTSFAILSLLAVRDWTAYGLAQQMERSVGGMWPRAASVVYEEPKRLVERGLATARTEHTGRRPSTVYSITDDGRSELADWLEKPGDEPALEYEALLKIAFADHGSLDALRTNVDAVRGHAEQRLADARGRLDEYAEGGPYPDRLPVILLAMRFFVEQARALDRWSRWVDEVTDGWDSTSPSMGAEVPTDAFDH